MSAPIEATPQNIQQIQSQATSQLGWGMFGIGQQFAQDIFQVEPWLFGYSPLELAAAVGNQAAESFATAPYIYGAGAGFDLGMPAASATQYSPDGGVLLSELQSYVTAREDLSQYGIYTEKGIRAANMAPIAGYGFRPFGIMHPDENYATYLNMVGQWDKQIAAQEEAVAGMYALADASGPMNQQYQPAFLSIFGAPDMAFAQTQPLTDEQVRLYAVQMEGELHRLKNSSPEQWLENNVSITNQLVLGVLADPFDLAGNIVGAMGLRVNQRIASRAAQQYLGAPRPGVMGAIDRLFGRSGMGQPPVVDLANAEARAAANAVPDPATGYVDPMSASRMPGMASTINPLGLPASSQVSYHLDAWDALGAQIARITSDRQEMRFVMSRLTHDPVGSITNGIQVPPGSFAGQTDMANTIHLGQGPWTNPTILEDWELFFRSRRDRGLAGMNAVSGNARIDPAEFQNEWNGRMAGMLRDAYGADALSMLDTPSPGRTIGATNDPFSLIPNDDAGRGSGGLGGFFGRMTDAVSGGLGRLARRFRGSAVDAATGLTELEMDAMGLWHDPGPAPHIPHQGDWFHDPFQWQAGMDREESAASVLLDDLPAEYDAGLRFEDLPALPHWAIDEQTGLRVSRGVVGAEPPQVSPLEFFDWYYSAAGPESVDLYHVTRNLSELVESGKYEVPETTSMGRYSWQERNTAYATPFREAAEHYIEVTRGIADGIAPSHMNIMYPEVGLARFRVQRGAGSFLPGLASDTHREPAREIILRAGDISGIRADDPSFAMLPRDERLSADKPLPAEMRGPAHLGLETYGDLFEVWRTNHYHRSLDEGLTELSDGRQFPEPLPNSTRPVPDFLDARRYWDGVDIPPKYFPSNRNPYNSFSDPPEVAPDPVIQFIDDHAPESVYVELQPDYDNIGGSVSFPDLSNYTPGKSGLFGGKVLGPKKPAAVDPAPPPDSDLPFLIAGGGWGAPSASPPAAATNAANQGWFMQGIDWLNRQIVAPMNEVGGNVLQKINHLQLGAAVEGFITWVPGAQIGNATVANFSAAVDGVFNAAHIDEVDAQIYHMGATRRVMDGLPDGPGSSRGGEFNSYAVESGGNDSVFDLLGRWGGNRNPLAQFSSFLSNIWTGDTNVAGHIGFGEAANARRVFASAQESFVSGFGVPRMLEQINEYVAAGMTSAQAQEFLNYMSGAIVRDPAGRAQQALELQREAKLWEGAVARERSVLDGLPVNSQQFAMQEQALLGAEASMQAARDAYTEMRLDVTSNTGRGYYAQLGWDKLREIVDPAYNWNTWEQARNIFTQQTLPLYDDIVSGANRAATDQVRHTMFDASYKNNLVSWLSAGGTGFANYAFYGIVNTAARVLENPGLLSKYFAVENAIGRENERSGVGLENQGAFPISIFGQEFRVRNPIDRLLLPIGKFGGNEIYGDPLGEAWQRIQSGGWDNLQNWHDLTAAGLGYLGMAPMWLQGLLNHTNRDVTIEEVSPLAGALGQLGRGLYHTGLLALDQMGADVYGDNPHAQTASNRLTPTLGGDTAEASMAGHLREMLQAGQFTLEEYQAVADYLFRTWQGQPALESEPENIQQLYSRFQASYSTMQGVAGLASTLLGVRARPVPPGEAEVQTARQGRDAILDLLGPAEAGQTMASENEIWDAWQHHVAANPGVNPAVSDITSMFYPDYTSRNGYMRPGEVPIEVGDQVVVAGSSLEGRYKYPPGNERPPVGDLPLDQVNYNPNAIVSLGGPYSQLGDRTPLRGPGRELILPSQPFSLAPQQGAPAPREGVQGDDFTIAKGIGPAGQRDAYAAGYTTWAQLSRATLAEIEAIPGLDSTQAMALYSESRAVGQQQFGEQVSALQAQILSEYRGGAEGGSGGVSPQQEPAAQPRALTFQEELELLPKIGPVNGGALAAQYDSWAELAGADPQFIDENIDGYGPTLSEMVVTEAQQRMAGGGNGATAAAAQDFWLYALTDPRDDSVHYIGKTRQEPVERFAQHLNDDVPEEGINHPKTRWIRNLLQEGLVPEQRVFGHFSTQQEMDDWELIWIGYFTYSSGATGMGNMDNVSLPSQQEYQDLMRQYNVMPNDLREIFGLIPEYGIQQGIAQPDGSLRAPIDYVTAGQVMGGMPYFTEIEKLTRANRATLAQQGFQSWQEIVDFGLDGLNELEGFGDVKAQNVYDYALAQINGTVAGDFNPLLQPFPVAEYPRIYAPGVTSVPGDDDRYLFPTIFGQLSSGSPDVPGFRFDPLSSALPGSPNPYPYDPLSSANAGSLPDSSYQFPTIFGRLTSGMPGGPSVRFDPLASAVPGSLPPRYDPLSSAVPGSLPPQTPWWEFGLRGAGGWRPPANNLYIPTEGRVGPYRLPNGLAVPPIVGGIQPDLRPGDLGAPMGFLRQHGTPAYDGHELDPRRGVVAQMNEYEHPAASVGSAPSAPLLPEFPYSRGFVDDGQHHTFSNVVMKPGVLPGQAFYYEYMLRDDGVEVRWDVNAPGYWTYNGLPYDPAQYRPNTSGTRNPGYTSARGQDGTVVYDGVEYGGQPYSAHSTAVASVMAQPQRTTVAQPSAVASATRPRGAAARAGRTATSRTVPSGQTFSNPNWGDTVGNWTVVGDPITDTGLEWVSPVPEGTKVYQHYGETDVDGLGPYYANKNQGFGHEGIDWMLPEGTPIMSISGGKVVFVGDGKDEGRPAYGNMVVVEHPNGMKSRYGHLSGFNVSVGDTVTPGQEIGYVGHTPTTANIGDHLHLSVESPDEHTGPYRTIDPFRLIGQGSSAAAEQAVAADADNPYAKTMAEMGAKYGLPPGLLEAVAAHETSGYDPKAVSPAGAMGVMQIMPITWEQAKNNVKGLDDPFNAEQSIEAGAYYLDWLRDTLPEDKQSVEWIATAYNWGPNRVLGASGPAAAPPETQAYAQSIAAQVGNVSLAQGTQWKYTDNNPSPEGFFNFEAFPGVSVAKERILYAAGITSPQILLGRTPEAIEELESFGPKSVEELFGYAREVMAMGGVIPPAPTKKEEEKEKAKKIPDENRTLSGWFNWEMLPSVSAADEKRLYQAGIYTPEGLFARTPADIAKLQGFGEKSASDLFAETRAELGIADPVSLHSNNGTRRGALSGGLEQEQEAGASKDPDNQNPTPEGYYNFEIHKGVGPAMEQALYDAGITTKEQFLAAGASTIDAVKQWGPKTIESVTTELGGAYVAPAEGKKAQDDNISAEGWWNWEQYKGIGTTKELDLYEAGITSRELFLGADVDFLAGIKGFSEESIGELRSTIAAELEAERAAQEAARGGQANKGRQSMRPQLAERGGDRTWISQEQYDDPASRGNLDTFVLYEDLSVANPSFERWGSGDARLSAFRRRSGQIGPVREDGNFGAYNMWDGESPRPPLPPIPPPASPVSKLMVQTANRYGYSDKGRRALYNTSVALSFQGWDRKDLFPYGGMGGGYYMGGELGEDGGVETPTGTDIWLHTGGQFGRQQELGLNHEFMHAYHAQHMPAWLKEEWARNWPNAFGGDQERRWARWEFIKDDTGVRAPTSFPPRGYSEVESYPAASEGEGGGYIPLTEPLPQEVKDRYFAGLYKDGAQEWPLPGVMLASSSRIQSPNSAQVSAATMVSPPAPRVHTADILRERDPLLTPDEHGRLGSSEVRVAAMPAPKEFRLQGEARQATQGELSATKIRAMVDERQDAMLEELLKIMAERRK